MKLNKMLTQDMVILRDFIENDISRAPGVLVSLLKIQHDGVNIKEPRSVRTQMSDYDLEIFGEYVKNSGIAPRVLASVLKRVSDSFDLDEMEEILGQYYNPRTGLSPESDYNNRNKNKNGYGIDPYRDSYDVNAKYKPK